MIHPGLSSLGRYVVVADRVLLRKDETYDAGMTSKAAKHGISTADRTPEAAEGEAMTAEQAIFPAGGGAWVENEERELLAALM